MKETRDYVIRVRLTIGEIRKLERYCRTMDWTISEAVREGLELLDKKMSNKQ